MINNILSEDITFNTLFFPYSLKIEGIEKIKLVCDHFREIDKYYITFVIYFTDETHLMVINTKMDISIPNIYDVVTRILVDTLCVMYHKDRIKCYGHKEQNTISSEVGNSLYKNSNMEYVLRGMIDKVHNTLLKESL